ncbi:hypothetical protein SLE2022_033050 [Rubroshorea leprosula]
MGELLVVEENHIDHGKLKERGEEANVKGRQVAAAGDEEAEHEEGEDGVVEVAVACVDGKGIGMDVEARKKGHELMAGTVDVGQEIQTVAAAVCWLLVAAVGHMPLQKLLHNYEVVDP